MGEGEAGAGARRPAAEPLPRSPAQHPLADEAERVAFALGDKLAAAPGRETPEAVAAAVESTPAVETGRGPGAGGEAGDGDGRGGALAAGVLGRAAGTTAARAGGTLRPGVDRLRGTLVAFDEAGSDDPGLRFVVAAAVLFLVFLLLWLFSYTLG